MPLFFRTEIFLKPAAGILLITAGVIGGFLYPEFAAASDTDRKWSIDGGVRYRLLVFHDFADIHYIFLYGGINHEKAESRRKGFQTTKRVPSRLFKDCRILYYLLELDPTGSSSNQRGGAAGT